MRRWLNKTRFKTEVFPYLLLNILIVRVNDAEYRIFTSIPSHSKSSRLNTRMLRDKYIWEELILMKLKYILREYFYQANNVSQRKSRMLLNCNNIENNNLLHKNAERQSIWAYASKLYSMSRFFNLHNQSGRAEKEIKKALSLL